MRQGKYLNVILTVNAALLSALVWMQLAGSSALSSTAHAQKPSSDPGIPNAAVQRQRMIEELQTLRESVDGVRKTLEGGKMKVTIANVDEIKAAASKQTEDGKGK